MMIQVRAKSIDDERLLQGLEQFLDDLRLIVDSLDPLDRPFEVSLAELRGRIEPRCDAAGIELTWTPHERDTPLSIDPEQALRCSGPSRRRSRTHSDTPPRTGSTSRCGARRGREDDRNRGARLRGRGFDPWRPGRAAEASRASTAGRAGWAACSRSNRPTLAPASHSVFQPQRRSRRGERPSPLAVREASSGARFAGPTC